MNQQAHWEIDAMPFIWGALPFPHNLNGLPDELPFVLAFDPRTGLVVQEHRQDVTSALERAYDVGSVLGSNVDEAGIGRQYADDFLAFMARSGPRGQAPGAGLLEIGCGNGYLLSRLRDEYGTVLGIEPGVQGEAGAARYNVEIIRGFFPSPQLAGRKFSAIVMTSVLEHLEDPVAFSALLRDYLVPGGKVFLSVPDESPYICSNDVSTLFHEHWSYFDQQTLKNVMCLAGLAVRRCELSSFGGSIYAELSADGAGAGTVAPEHFEVARAVAIRYIRNARANCGRLREACERMQSGGRTLGVYVPARFVNAMRISGMGAEGVRFFDDDPGLRGSYYPGIPVRVENRAELLQRPVDALLIMSRTFGPRLAARLRDELPAATEIALVADLLD